jgi:hypothetical protein
MRCLGIAAKDRSVSGSREVMLQKVHPLDDVEDDEHETIKVR